MGIILNQLLKTTIIQIKGFFIKNKNLRKRWKRFATNIIIKEIVSKNKWGVSYSVFDSEELLEYSIKAIRNQVDYVNVVYQLESWYGNPANDTLLPLLYSLKEKGLIDEIIEYEPNPSIKSLKQERNKRNIGLKYAKKAGVNYFMTMDCDEFYIEKEVERAKEFIIKNGITHSYVDIFNYYSPTLRYLTPTYSYVNFFSKIKKYSKLTSHNSKTITLIDPTRKISDFWSSKYYFLPRIAMHHMTYYRKDIISKIMNSTGRDFIKSIPEPYNCVEVPDLFSINGIF
ncbi:hypothetical protein J6R97_00030 [bacterium]|nr:hypothetical protein [bacterium]